MTSDAAGPPPHGRCLNCGEPLAGAYCARCGQKRPRLDLTLRDVFRDAAEELFDWDGKVPRTIASLFLRPGELTRDFLAGRRARWLPPLRLYLICSLIFFVIRPAIELVSNRPVRAVANITLTGAEPGTPLTPEEREVLARGLPGRMLGIDRLERAAAQPEALNRAVESALPRSMFILLPVFAALTRVLWGRSLPRYPAHLYAALHMHAAVFASLSVLSLFVGFAPTGRTASIALAIVGLYVVVYVLIAFRQVFGESWMKTVAKSVVMAVLYGLCMIVMGTALVALAVATM